MAEPDEADPGHEFEIRLAWRRDNPGIAADAIALWNRLGVLPGEVNPADRARQLVAAAYRDGQMAAVCTAVAEPVAFLRARLLVLRCLTAPEFRRSRAQVALAGPVREALAAWAAAHPEEGIGGMIGFLDPLDWGDAARHPVMPAWNTTLVAHTHDGLQVRVDWFDHYRLP